MRTKLTSHLQMLQPDADVEFQRRLQAAWVKLHQAEAGHLHRLLDVVERVCLRHHAISEAFDELLRDPAALGRSHGDYWGRVLRQEWRLTDAQISHCAVEGLNEPPVANAHEAARVDAYSIAFAESASQYGIRVATPCLSTGWPYNHGTGTPPDYEPFQGLVDALRRTGSYWADHEYWDGRGPESGDWLWNPGRLMTRPDWMRGNGFRALITECGYDQKVNAPPSTPHHGWRGHFTPVQYAANQLGVYDRHYQSDPDVKALMVFLLHTDNDPAWGTFDISDCREQILAHAAWLAAQPNDEPVVDPEPGNGHTVHLPIVTKPEKPAQEATMRVVDKDGMERDWAYLTDKYGAIEHLGRERFRERFALSEVRETVGPAVVMVTVQGKNGEPLPGYQVAFAWPDAPVDLTPHDYITKWRSRAAVQPTNENGDTGFGLGDGSYIRDLAEGGPHTTWVLSDQIPSEGLANFGMLGGTNHEGPLRLTFQLADTTVEPTPTPNPEPIPQPDHTNASLEKTIARLLDVDLPVLRAVLQVESGGRGHNGDGRLMIRFETHIFRRYISSVDFAEHFRVDGPAAWEGHRFNDGSGWRNIHASQNNEWAALGIAAVLDREAALRATAMGAAQIMGFNHETVGYNTVGEMFDAFSASITPQLLGFVFFLLNTSGCLEALKARDFLAFAQLYNGLGNAPTYARLIQEAIARLERP